MPGARVTRAARHRAPGDGTAKLILDQTVNDDEHILLGAPKAAVAETFTAYSWEPGRTA